MFLSRKMTKDVQKFAQFKEWALKQSLEYTPDVGILSQYPIQRLFVPDELQRFHPGEDLLRDYSEPLGHGFTKTQFSMFKTRLGREYGQYYPVIVEDRFSTSPFARIKGELYAVSAGLFSEQLDRYKENGVQFVRKRIIVDIPFRTVRKELEQKVVITADGKRSSRVTGSTTNTSDLKQIQVKAWMYIASSEFWLPLIDDGFLFQPVKTYTDKSGKPYYFFSKMEHYD